MSGLKLIHVNKRGPQLEPTKLPSVKMNQDMWKTYLWYELVPENETKWNMDWNLDNFYIAVAYVK